MGGDHGPSVVVPGFKSYIQTHGGEGVRFLLHGDEAKIAAELTRCGLSADGVEIRHTEKVVAMDEKPAQAMRRGKGSSLWNAIEAVKTGEAAAAVSAAVDPGLLRRRGRLLQQEGRETPGQPRLLLPGDLPHRGLRQPVEGCIQVAGHLQIASDVSTRQTQLSRRPK